MKNRNMKKIVYYLSAILVFSCTKIKSQDYAKHLESIQKKKLEFKTQYQKSTRKDTVLANASAFIENQLTENLYQFWESTEWDFNGITDTPKTGQIACGYYVSTNLKHLGFQINRYKMAQQSAESEVKTLDPNLKKFYGTSAEFIEYAMKNLNDGLYILGMSSHVGMIQKKGGNLYFLHSSPINRMGVTKEIASESAVLSWSDVFVVGKVSHNNALIKKWILGETITVILDNQ
jgi:hypothetical protein